MGTTSLTTVKYEGEEVLRQYSRRNGVPGETGLAIAQFLRQPEYVEQLKRGLNCIDYIDESDNRIEETDAKIEETLQRAARISRLCEPDSRELDSEMAEEIAISKNWLEFSSRPTPTSAEKIAHLQPSFSLETGAGILATVSLATREKRIQIVRYSTEDKLIEYSYTVDLDCETLLIESFWTETPRSRKFLLSKLRTMSDDELKAFLQSTDWQAAQQSII